MMTSCSGAGAVVRLCGAQGLESALLASRQDSFKMAILPVVVARGRGYTAHRGAVSGYLPKGGLSVIIKRLPQPCYFRVDLEKLFSREAWLPITSKLSDSTRLREGLKLVFEADTLSSDVPQSLLTYPPADMDDSREYQNEWSGRLSTDQAIWGLNMLRTGLENCGWGDRGVAGVVLAGTRLAGLGHSVVSIDARAALLVSVVSWAEQCTAKGVGASNVPYSERDPIAAEENYSSLENHSGESTTLSAVLDASYDTVITSPDDCATGQLETSGVEDKMEKAKDIRSEDPEAYDIMGRMFGALERVGRGVRIFFTPQGLLQSTINHCTSLLEKWKIVTTGETKRVFLYDTDDDNSYKWLAAQVT